MRKIHALKLHVAHSCNLSCESCSHYSNQGHKGLANLDEAVRWMRLWNRRLLPATFTRLAVNRRFIRSSAIS